MMKINCPSNDRTGVNLRGHFLLLFQYCKLNALVYPLKRVRIKDYGYQFWLFVCASSVKVSSQSQQQQRQATSVLSLLLEAVPYPILYGAIKYQDIIVEKVCFRVYFNKAKSMVCLVYAVEAA